MTQAGRSTCVLSEFTKRRADPGVVEWLAIEDESSMFVYELSLGELEKVLNKLSDTARRTKLRAFIDQEIIERFQGRIVPVDAAAARGRQSADRVRTFRSQASRW